MAKLKSSIALETAFNRYTVDEILGEGGAGRVYGGQDDAGTKVAVKVLGQASTDKRRRFKNEIAFLSRTRHKNIVKVIDHGVVDAAGLKGPFYVMHRYAVNMRAIIEPGITPAKIMPLFSQVLDGVEAAHLLDVTHRDLKPENVLVDDTGEQAAIADFGIASFTQEQLHTLVETQPTQRLANFQYASPEQRTHGKQVGITADIYALGLILNEMFTGAVPHGTDYRTIGSVAEQFAFLDPIVAQMMRHEPSQRPGSIAAVKQLIQKHEAEVVSLQKLNQLEQVVIPAGEIDDSLAHEPPSLVGASWKDGLLTLELDRPVNDKWAQTLQYRMGNYGSIMGAEPNRFHFQGKTAHVSVEEGAAQLVIDYFKSWLVQTTSVYKQEREAELRQAEMKRRQELQQQRETEERNLRVNQALRI
jgi:serine/threonine protein kinase